MRHSPYPDEALPDCESCDKPELSPENLEVVSVFHTILRDAHYNDFSGHRRGLRFEAVVSAINWFWEAGQITDRDRVMRRIWELDRVFTRIHNDRIDAKSSR